MTELTLGESTEHRLHFETSKRKAIFSTAFAASSVILAMMWLAIKDTFSFMLHHSGAWIDQIIVRTFYAALIAYPVIALLFIGYYRSLTVDGKTGVLSMAHHLFGLCFHRHTIPLSDISNLRVEQVIKGKNIAHQHEHLQVYQNAGYWQLSATVAGKKKPVRIDRNTDRADMEALLKHLKRLI